MIDKTSGVDGGVDVGEFVETEHSAGQLQGRVWAPVRVLGQIAGLLTLVLALFVTATVLLRVVDLGVVGAVELASLSMVVLTVLIIPAVTAADDNFRVEIVDFLVGPRSLHWLNVFGLLVQLFVTAFITFAVLELFIHDIDTGTTMAGELYLRRWWLTAVVFIGFVGALYATVINLVRVFRSTLTNESEA
ncbi:TRAP transporter small permease [Corynebacterium halotolerans]|uniref:Tripartite ATP-independent periplasmic transporters DctQ component domain-containing protein n=1 Tax=Corynebacterium halotolerans YIM 70093 = DSM 44683 TaxID=1121362 RepID=M1P1M8_9CORY|nr:TRAP transporter small permease subunit [Corynebacterium halotolerans]AGF73715.1 hypothetical protein A605_13595 [Corynebacterium halotolerans YIM 70093 = DSM 44683]